MAERGWTAGGRAKRSLGQNFLVDPSVVHRIVEGAGVVPGETVVEVGPGRGALTTQLRARADRLVLVEKDDALADSLRRKFEGDDGVAVMNTDALELTPDALPFDGPYRVVSNLPYNVGGRISMHLLETWGSSLVSATLMFQREVAERITGAPGTRPYGALSVLVQSFAEAWSLFGVPPGAFRPVPKVQSRVVRLQRRPEPLWAGLDYEWFRKVVHGGFQARRKTLVNSLGLAPGLPSESILLAEAIREAGLDPSVRGDAVSVESYVRLATVLAAKKS